MLPPGCADTSQLDCVDRATYLHDLFLASGTTMAVLTDVPNSGPRQRPDPVPRGPGDAGHHRQPDRRRRRPDPRRERHRPQRRAGRRDPRRNEEHGESRPARRLQGVHGVEPERPRLLARGPRRRPAHRSAHARPRREGLRRPKGLPLVNFDPAFNHPDDIVAVSRQFPDMQFVVYRAAWTLRASRAPTTPTPPSASTRCSRRSTATAWRRTTTSGSTWRRSGASC